jgi:hypothetical protein
MAAFSFHIEHPGQDVVVLDRNLDDLGTALLHGRRLLAEWADSAFVDVLEAGVVVERFRRAAA